MTSQLICKTCDNSGYLDINPLTYCDCDAGIFYEERDELNEQSIYYEVDPELDEYDIDEYFEWIEPNETVLMFYELPFFIN